MNDEERALLVDYLAYNPSAGDLIPGTSGGGRVVYFHYDAGMPLFALTAYAKNERSDLSQQDRNDFKRLTVLLVATFNRRKP